MSHFKCSSKRKVYSNKCLSQEKEKKQDTEKERLFSNNLALHLKELEKEFKN